MSTQSSGLLQFICTKAASIMIAASAGASGASKTSLMSSGTTGSFDTELPEPKKVFLGLPTPGEESAGDLNERCTVLP